MDTPSTRFTYNLQSLFIAIAVACIFLTIATANIRQYHAARVDLRGLSGIPVEVVQFYVFIWGGVAAIAFVIARATSRHDGRVMAYGAALVAAVACCINFLRAIGSV